ncbi:DUF3413 domain-containing protein [Legionella pneumophila]|uniref:DUF3413 domain-containing protein n=1 Tax=Legionella pneumophila TaxID=446 RepID=UPI001374F5F4|nr:DUF3413 domain-containing protein [Legionella pneumophila]HAT8816300.1 DUF3413 domain-containing protein [Legionella pneumophila subsp. pneumophila]MCZ4806669.1 DUF3413 domain-containing protein [Legionella pneumophila]MDW9180388.1 DUF3413 domain-containing protein [Legionella pneumophila]HAT1824695.1 DUF3413 domain-containing protein [Legionella pneumophila]HAT1988338.1 DUF3413 domain-containing protein [Legionella pneumophila]
MNIKTYLKKNDLTLRFVGWFFLINSFIFWLVGLGYLKSILLNASLFKNYIADYSSLSGKILILVFSVLNYFTYMMFLAFVPAIPIIIMAFFLPYKRIIWIISVVAATTSLIFLFVDSQVFSMFKFHLNKTILSFVFNSDWSVIFTFSRYELILSFFMIVFILFLESIVAWLVWKKIVLKERLKIGKTISLFWLGGALISYFILLLSIAQNNNLFAQQIPNLPLYNQLIAYTIPDKNADDILRRYSEHYFTQPLFPNYPLHYPLHPMQCKMPEKPYNIILIMVDSLRYDSLSAKYMPNTAQFAKRSWQFSQHMSAGNATQPGLFSLFYSIPSNYSTAVLEQKKSPVLIDLLLQHGYQTKIIWSGSMAPLPLDQTIYKNIANLNTNGAPIDDTGDKDRYSTKEAIQFLTDPKTNNPFFLHIFYNAPHDYCRYQSFPQLYKPAIEECVRIGMTNHVDPVPYYNRYLNAVTFIDQEISKVLGVIEKKGYLKNSIIIITSDHGQEFNDNRQNYWGHTSNFTPIQLHVPMIIHWPGELARRFNYLTSSYDIVPTILQRLFACKNPVSDYSIGYNLLIEGNRASFLLVGSYINMGIFEADRATALETSGRITVTGMKAEPLDDAVPRMDVITKALDLMRKYYGK